VGQTRVPQALPPGPISAWGKNRSPVYKSINVRNGSLADVATGSPEGPLCANSRHCDLPGHFTQSTAQPGTFFWV
jgi:hypothetical protein